MAVTNPNLRADIDPVLTNLAMGYANEQFVHENVLPIIPVDTLTGKAPIFPKDHLKYVDMLRAPGADPKRIPVGQLTYSSYELDEYTPERTYDWTNKLSASAIFNLDTWAVDTIMSIMALKKEVDASVTLQTAANYPTGNKVTLTGNDQWNAVHADSTPLTDMTTGLNAIQGKVGIRGNTIILSQDSFNALQFHATMTDKIKYSQLGVLTTDLLATLLGSTAQNPINIYIGAAQYDVAGTMTDLWTDTCIIAYVPNAAQRSFFKPSFGYTYQFKGTPNMRKYFTHPSNLVSAVMGQLLFKQIITMNTAGYLIADTLG